METISIKVTDDAADKWNSLPNDIKQRISNMFQQQINAFSRQKSKKKLFELMDRIGAEAEKRGLTEEILQEILNEEE